MIYSQDFAVLFLNLGLNCSISKPFSISVYQGPQPSVADFITNFNAKYSNTNSNFLANFDGFIFAEDPQNVDHFTVQSYSQATPINSGIAKWCCIWPVDTNISTLGGNIPQTRIVLAPVTDTNGNGVVQFSSVSLEAGTPVSIASFTLLSSINN